MKTLALGFVALVAATAAFTAVSQAAPKKSSTCWECDGQGCRLVAAGWKTCKFDSPEERCETARLCGDSGGGGGAIY